MDAFVAFLILPGLNFCGLGGIHFGEGKVSLIFSENECFNLLMWPESRRDEGYMHDLVSRAWGVFSRNGGAG